MQAAAATGFQTAFSPQRQSFSLPLREKGLLPNLNTGLPLYPPDGVPPLFFIRRFHIHLCVHKVSQQACLNDEGRCRLKVVFTPVKPFQTASVSSALPYCSLNNFTEKL